MKEKNYDRLRQALDRLPDHDPPARNWEAIHRGLDREEATARAP